MYHSAKFLLFKHTIAACKKQAADTAGMSDTLKSVSSEEVMDVLKFQKLIA
jgi:hypothetical protein